MSIDQPKISRSLALSTRDQILASAGELFYEHGYRAVGVDAIVAHSGVAKMTLYRYFPSKNALIAAWLEQVHTQLLAWLDEAAASAEGDPRGQLQSIFAALEKLVQLPKCHGCAFLMAASEFPEPDSLPHSVALEHKQTVLARFETLAAEAGARDAHGLAEQLLLIMDGAFMHVRLFGQRDTGGAIVQAANALQAAHIRAG